MDLRRQKATDLQGVPVIPPVPDPNDPGLSKEAFLRALKAHLSYLREALLSAESRGGTGGRDFVRSYSQIVDTIVRIVFQRAVRESGLSPESPNIAVIGVGGYGRAELAPYSDVDILILCRRKTHRAKQIASAFVQLMWDVGFELGHAVESLVESESFVSRHMDTKTALIESRWICGSKRIGRAVERQISRIRRKDREAFLKRKVRDALARYQKYGFSYQLIEPNVKLSPGGLRDYQTLVWLGMVIQKDAGLSVLRKRGLLLAGEEKALDEAYDFLLKVRVELHLATRSKQDQLTVRMQRTVAQSLGYGGSGEHLGVELFMKDYYVHTKRVHQVTRDILEELKAGAAVDALLGRKRTARDGGKLAIPIHRRKLKAEPLYVFKRQKDVGLKLDRSVKRRLASVLEADLSGQADTARMRRALPQLLKVAKNNSLILREMHETGFLGRIIPEYNLLTCLKRYDLYHHYTADEHSFRVVGHLEELAETAGRRTDPLRRLYSEIPDKQALFLAALLHDVGKIKGRGHAKKGAVLTEKILRRMSLKHDQIEVVCFLIEHHLLMSHFSQRRDATDIGTLQTFCEKVKNRTNLKYLSLLTYADLKATSPHVWTEWKRNLLWRLYLAAYQHMAKSEKQPEAVYKARKRDILKTFPAGISREKALEHLDMLPGGYLLTMKPSQVKEHLRLVDRLRVEAGVVSARRRRYSTEITFCTPDKPFRLSELCGVLTMNDLNILYAHAFTRRDGKVIDVFHVEELIKDATFDEGRLGDIRRDLISVMQGGEDIRKRVREHIAKWKRKRDLSIPVPLKVEFENDLSGDFTIIDIFAQDAPGLLFKITRTLSSEGLVIYRARISTEANRAIDAFYVKDRSGRKVTGAARLRRIRTRLEAEMR